MGGDLQAWDLRRTFQPAVRVGWGTTGDPGQGSYEEALMILEFLPHTRRATARWSHRQAWDCRRRTFQPAVGSKGGGRVMSRTGKSYEEALGTSLSRAELHGAAV